MKKKSVKSLKFPLKGKYVAMVAPSFIVNFNFPSIINKLKVLGFDKVVELTLGARFVNEEYKKQLGKSKELLITSPCPGIVETIRHRYPQYMKNVAKIDSPMVATAKICKKTYPRHKTVFLSPCQFKKIEANNSKYVDYAIDYVELEDLFKKLKIKEDSKKAEFDNFTHTSTKIYPISGGLAKTAKLKGIINENEIAIIDGISNVTSFLKNPKSGVRFLDVLFCDGGCIGGPCVKKDLSIADRKKQVLKYLNKSIANGKNNKRIVVNVDGLSFSR